MEQLQKTFSNIFKNQEDLVNYLDKLSVIDDPKHLKALDLEIFQEMIEIVKKQ